MNNSEEQYEYENQHTLRTKELPSYYSYQEALNKESSGWRLPTIFELMKLAKGRLLKRKGEFYISSSGDSDYNGRGALVRGTNGYGSLLFWGVTVNSSKWLTDTKRADFEGNRVVLVSTLNSVSGGTHATPNKRGVSYKELRTYLSAENLPAWHAPIKFADVKRPSSFEHPSGKDHVNDTEGGVGNTNILELQWRSTVANPQTVAKQNSEFGWRLPTVFELLHIAKSSHSEDDVPYWSASGENMFGWSVSLFDATYRKEDPNTENSIVYVKGGSNFDFEHDVQEAEIRMFDSMQLLPAWHPPFTLAVEEKRRVEQQNVVKRVKRRK